MKDRLAELRNLQRDNPPDYGYDETVFDSNAPANSNPFIDDFFIQIDEIQQNISSIKGNVSEVKKKHSDILTAPQPSDRVKEQLEELMADIKRSANRVQSNLKSMERHIKEQDNANNFAEIRIKRAQANKRSLLKIAGRSTTDDELEDMIESGNPAIFTQGIIVETQQAKQSLRDIEARHNDIMKLETSIRELHEMFTDMAILVESQGEMINNIETNVIKASEYIQSAARDVKKAVTYQSKARRTNQMNLTGVPSLRESSQQSVH
eukprot:gene13758-15197_t